MASQGDQRLRVSTGSTRPPGPRPPGTAVAPSAPAKPRAPAAPAVPAVPGAPAEPAAPAAPAMPGAPAVPGAGVEARSEEPSAPPLPDEAFLRHLAIGLLSQAQDQVRRVGGPVGALARSLAPMTRQLARIPLFEAGTRQAADRLASLADRGRREEEDYRRRADDVVRQAASAAVRSPALDDVVDQVATRLAGPVVNAQLPLVLQRLSERPEPLRRIVDETVDRFANRFLQRPNGAGD